MTEVKTTAQAVNAAKNAKNTTSAKKDSKTIDKLAMVITTYKRQNLLATLFESILALEQAPWRVIVVDNEHSDETKSMAEDFSAKVTAQWGKTVADRAGNPSRVVSAPQTENLGGAGGFSAGVKKAYQLGAEWFWVMDDDVAVLPDGIAKLAPWTRRHEVIQGSRFDYDGGPFYWQYDFRIGLGIPNPIAPAAFGRAGFRTMTRCALKAACSTVASSRRSVCRIRDSSSTGTTRFTATVRARSPRRSSSLTSCCAARARSATGTSPACASSTPRPT